MGELLRSPAVADASLYRASSVFSRLCSKLSPLLLARLDDKVAVSGEGVKSLSAGPVWYDDVQRQHAALTGQADWQRFVGLFSVAQSDIGETGMVELSRVLCRNDIVIGTVPQIDYPSLISRLYRSARLIKLTGLHHVTWDTGNPHGILQRFPSAALPGCYATGRAATSGPTAKGYVCWSRRAMLSEPWVVDVRAAKSVLNVCPTPNHIENERL
jgi:hypothetical protein